MALRPSFCSRFFRRSDGACSSRNNYKFAPRRLSPMLRRLWARPVCEAHPSSQPACPRRCFLLSIPTAARSFSHRHVYNWIVPRVVRTIPQTWPAEFPPRVPAQGLSGRGSDECSFEGQREPRYHFFILVSFTPFSQAQRAVEAIVKENFPAVTFISP